LEGEKERSATLGNKGEGAMKGTVTKVIIDSGSSYSHVTFRIKNKYPVYFSLLDECEIKQITEKPEQYCCARCMFSGSKIEVLNHDCIKKK